MPRIAVAIFVVVAVSVSIGINIARYPAVFVVAGSTHESLVSDDTKDVSETEETEGTVAVSTIPALPDEDLAKWNPPIVTGVTPTVTEAVPHVASHNEYTEDVYERTSTPDAEAASEPRADSPVEATAPTSPELNHYEVEPYRPYTEDRGETREERREEESPATSEQPTVSSAVETSSNSVWDRPVLGEETPQPQSVERPALEQPTPQSSVPQPSTQYRPAPSEGPLSSTWPATVADSFRYNQEVSSQASRSAASSFYDQKSNEQEPRTSVQSVSSTSSNAMPDSNMPSVRKPLRLDDSAMIFEEESDWEASVPLVATLDNQSSREETLVKEPSHTQVKRLPVVEGADILPGALPPLQPIAYPVTR